MLLRSTKAFPQAISLGPLSGSQPTFPHIPEPHTSRSAVEQCHEATFDHPDRLTAKLLVGYLTIIQIVGTEPDRTYSLVMPDRPAQTRRERK